MKNTFFLFIAALFISAAVHAQSTADSIQAKYKLLPMPEALTVEKTFPVLGTYQLNSADSSASPITITMDSSSKGIVWVDGLPEGRIKAYLKQSPATYRIVAQKSSTDKQVSEGTMIFNPETNTLNISLGAPFNDADPAAIFTTVNGATASTDVTSVTDESAHAAKGSTTAKVKTKKGTEKTKHKVVFYTATKSVQNNTTTSGEPQQQQQQ